nr:PREDICTED: uncharacterized protein LOC102366511 isoform X2 [Latimeria chalumnae]|eukprot:XP_014339766.1 PREDICTED: uncharacterized protein LOC102366511 isoform X2 [Latimeria chalumnae]
MKSTTVFPRSSSKLGPIPRSMLKSMKPTDLANAKLSKKKVPKSRCSMVCDMVPNWLKNCWAPSLGSKKTNTNSQHPPLHFKYSIEPVKLTVEGLSDSQLVLDNPPHYSHCVDKHKVSSNVHLFQSGGRNLCTVEEEAAHRHRCVHRRAKSPKQHSRHRHQHYKEKVCTTLVNPAVFTDTLISSQRQATKVRASKMSLRNGRSVSRTRVQKSKKASRVEVKARSKSAPRTLSMQSIVNSVQASSCTSETGMGTDQNVVSHSECTHVAHMSISNELANRRGRSRLPKCPSREGPGQRSTTPKGSCPIVRTYLVGTYPSPAPLEIQTTHEYYYTPNASHTYDTPQEEDTSSNQTVTPELNSPIPIYKYKVVEYTTASPHPSSSRDPSPQVIYCSCPPENELFAYSTTIDENQGPGRVTYDARANRTKASQHVRKERPQKAGKRSRERGRPTHRDVYCYALSSQTNMLDGTENPNLPSQTSSSRRCCGRVSSASRSPRRGKRAFSYYD